MNRRKRPPMQRAERIGSLLKQLYNQPGIGEQLSRHQAWLIWDQLVGEQIAARARPLRLRKGTLEVQVDHPVWMQQLQMLKPKILEKINQRIPSAEISDIYLRLAKGSPPPQQLKSPRTGAPPKWTRIELTETEKAEITAELRQIGDRELRQGLARLLTLQKQLDKDRLKD